MTTVTLNPNVTDGLAVFTIVGAATAHAATSDASDASYLNLATAGAGDKFVPGFSTFTLPAGAITKQTRAKVRASNVSVPGEFDVEALPGTSPVPMSTAFFPPVAITDHTTAWVPILLSQAQIDSLRYSINQGTVGLRVYEAALEVQYVTIPVVVVDAVTPDPYTASSVVPVSWVNTLDADGGVQTTYQIRVFTAAQYSAGGFNPDTSDAFWETADKVFGATTSANIGPLLNSTTYRVYVRAAQTVNSATHWSAWAFDQFATSFAPPTVLSVTASAVNALARIDVTVNRDTGGVAWDFVELQRSVDAGVTWSDVRSATYVAATGNTFTVSDWETGNGQSTLYRARGTRIVSSLPLTGAWVSSSSVSWTSALTWLKSPLNPSKNLAVTLEAPFAAQERTLRAGEFDVIGRTAPVVISDVVSLPASLMTVRTDLAADLPKMIALTSDINLLFQQIPESRAGQSQSGSQYVSVRSFAEAQRVPFYTDMRLWTIGYVEVDAPADPLAGR